MNNNKLKNILLTVLTIGSLISTSNLTFAEAAIIYAGQGGDTTPPIIVADMATAEQPTQMPAMVNTVDNVAVTNGGAEETMKFDKLPYRSYGLELDTGLTRSQIESMTIQKGALYFIQKYPLIKGDMRVAGSIFVSLWRQILKEEFPEALSNGQSPEGLHWILGAGYGSNVKAVVCGLTASEYAPDGRFFMQKEQKPTQHLKTFGEFKEYVRDCDRILREKGYY